MSINPDTRIMEHRLQRDIELRRAERLARLGPLPETRHRRRSAIGAPASWLRSAVSLFRTRGAPRAELGG